jgi:hypothetical protein
MRVVRPPAHGPEQLATALVSSGLAGGPGRATSSAHRQAPAAAAEVPRSGSARAAFRRRPLGTRAPGR